jgi:hypothetical protein
MSDGAAYKTKSPSVMKAWRAFLKAHEEQMDRHQEMVDRYGRNLYCNSDGFGLSVRVTGFESLEDDELGQVLGELGELRVPARRQYPMIVKPNIRRKAGKDLRDELESLTIPGPQLPGMPEWTLVGLSVLRVRLTTHGDWLYAWWAMPIEDSTQKGQVSKRLWKPIKLSEYYAMVEAR